MTAPAACTLLPDGAGQRTAVSRMGWDGCHVWPDGTRVVGAAGVRHVSVSATFNASRGPRGHLLTETVWSRDWIIRRLIHAESPSFQENGVFFFPG